ncbi:MAG: multi-sensor hybrid histidine kinase, partial [uncultured bacterium]
MDDQKEVCDFFYRILESLGYDVVCKNDGKETLEYFNNEVKDKRNITAFILDLTVPGGIGGKEAVALIRKFNSEIPVFVSSGYAEDPIMRNPV